MPRYRFDFRLDSAKPHEKRIIKIINQLKTERKYVTSIRDGLRLIVDLRAGRLDVLFELFPWIEDALKPATPPANTSSLEQRIEQLQTLILQQGAGSQNGLLMTSMPAFGTVGTGKSLTMKHEIAMPTFDDEEDQPTVVIKRDANAGSSFVENMLRSVELLGNAPIAADAKILTAPREMSRRKSIEADDDIVVKRAIAP